MSKMYKCPECDCNYISTDIDPEPLCKWCQNEKPEHQKIQELEKQVHQQGNELQKLKLENEVLKQKLNHATYNWDRAIQDRDKAESRWLGLEAKAAAAVKAMNDTIWNHENDFGRCGVSFLREALAKIEGKE